MAGPNISYHAPILPIMNRANTAPLTNGLAELASQTFKNGTPVQMASSGFVQAWDGTTVSHGILGVSESFGLNLASNGLGAPGVPFGPIGAPGAIQTYGYVINEPLAVNIALGTPMSDGRTLFVYANNDNIFEAIYDNSAGTVAADYTPTQAMINTSAGQLGLTADSNHFWYVDADKTGGDAVLQIVGINPLDGFIVNARVRFQFLAAAQQNQ
jgi:hypothetical protein